jgi:hypothetical protein
MNVMSAPLIEPADLLDLKLLPAWVKKSDTKSHYEHYTGEGDVSELRSRDGDRRHKDRKFRSRERQPHSQDARSKPKKRQWGRMPKPADTRRRHSNRAKARRSPDPRAQAAPQLSSISIGFLPRQTVLENVVAQIKSGSVAYSLFALARLFLEKPGRYEVRLTAKAEAPLYQLGEGGVVSVNRELLERTGFRFAQHDFYKINISDSEPIKGNFSNVARCRLSGTFLGPTNYHTYQLQLRSLYEQRFSRRMSFADYQRQIEIVSDPALIERWKDEARKVTTYTSLREETPLTFSSATEAERHFRSQYLPGLIRSSGDVTIGGALSRHLPDRTLNRTIELAWVHETGSPSNMMQELAGRFRRNGLHIFRHRRGMLFVSPIRLRAFVHEHAGVSSSVNAILESISAAGGTSRKQLFEKVTGNGAPEEVQPRRLALAADLRWLINEGYVIEFNDGSLDLPRGKTKQPQVAAPVEAAVKSSGEPIAGLIEWRWAKPPLQLTWRQP